MYWFLSDWQKLHVISKHLGAPVKDVYDGRPNSSSSFTLHGSKQILQTKPQRDKTSNVVYKPINKGAKRPQIRNYNIKNDSVVK